MNGPMYAGLYSAPHMITLNAAIMLIFNAGQQGGHGIAPCVGHLTRSTLTRFRE
jgi:hypothetical protein